MKLLEQRPGELFLLCFVLVGILLTVTVAIIEPLSGIASRSFDDGLINGAGWVAENH